jgi:hypothetical protein
VALQAGFFGSLQSVSVLQPVTHDLVLGSQTGLLLGQLVLDKHSTH